jgi:hypothetical protein
MAVVCDRQRHGDNFFCIMSHDVYPRPVFVFSVGILNPWGDFREELKVGIPKEQDEYKDEFYV